MTSGSRSPRILLVAPKFNYGREREGYSYEYYNFYDSLLRMGNEVILFDFMRLLDGHGKTSMNARLLEVVRSEQPDVLLAVPHREELAPDVVRSISEESNTVTVSWFSDDHWRFESYTARWAPCFNWSVTTASSALPKYRALGYAQVIKSQWACNHFAYRPLELQLRYGVTFVGQPHGTRRSAIAAIREAGIEVHVWGRGWESGRLSQEEMLRIFSASRINLNLSNASAPRSAAGRALALMWAVAGSDSVQPPLRRPLHRVLSRFERFARPVLPRNTWDPNSDGSLEQIKGRNFEVPGCAGLLLTGNTDTLAEYYVPGRDVTTFSSVETMIDQIRYLMSHEDDRRRIKSAGYRRTLHEHTYVHRFAEIFGRLGVLLPPLDDMLAGRVQPGRASEVP